MNVAIVGNDSKSCLQLQDLLERQEYSVFLVSEPAKALSRLEKDPAHLVVVNGLPSKDAVLELVRTLRAHLALRSVPILVVDPKAGPLEVVGLLDAGSDDCLVKPFNGQIFLARVRTLLRRQIWNGAAQEDPVTVLRAGELTLKLVERTAALAGAELVLTRLEFDLLSYLVRNQDKALRRSEILEAVWKYPQGVETRTLDKHVETLRRKLGPVGDMIRTVHGVGYRFLDPESSLAQRPGE